MKTMTKKDKPPSMYNYNRKIVSSPIWPAVMTVVYGLPQGEYAVFLCHQGATHQLHSSNSAAVVGRGQSRKNPENLRYMSPL